MYLFKYFLNFPFLFIMQRNGNIFRFDNIKCMLQNSDKSLYCFTLFCLQNMCPAIPHMEIDLNFFVCLWAFFNSRKIGHILLEQKILVFMVFSRFFVLSNVTPAYWHTLRIWNQKTFDIIIVKYHFGIQFELM